MEKNITQWKTEIQTMNQLKHANAKKERKKDRRKEKERKGRKEGRKIINSNKSKIKNKKHKRATN